MLVIRVVKQGQESSPHTKPDPIIPTHSSHIL